ncbi:UNVERIFIED_ORG: NACHT domain-containing protein [Actinomadura viridilutea]
MIGVMLRGGRARWSWRRRLAVTVVLAAMVVPFLPLGGKNGLSVGANLAQLTALVVTVMGLLVPDRLRLTPPSRRTKGHPTPADIDEAAEALAQILIRQWDAEAVARSLYDRDPIPVRWRLSEQRLMDHPANIESRPPEAVRAKMRWSACSADVDALADRFRALRRRRLVITGGPGTGKTTLAVQLLLHLLKKREPRDPVPVLLPASGWDVARHGFHDWLADRIIDDYPQLSTVEWDAEVVRELVAQKRVLPILDGLDELPPGARAAVISSLNRSLSGDDQLILTSRVDDYANAVSEAGEVLASAAVLEAQPLTPAEAAHYLELSLPVDPRPEWKEVLESLRNAGASAPSSATDRTSTPLAEIAETALGLWLLRIDYLESGADPSPLTDPERFPDAAALRAHLFDRLIPALIAVRERRCHELPDVFQPRRKYRPDDIRRWLGYLAWHLTHPRNSDGSPRTRDFAWWELARHTVAAGAVGTPFALASILIVGLALGLVVGFGEGVIPGLLGGFSGSLVGLIAWFQAVHWKEDKPGYAVCELRDRLGFLIRALAGQLVLWIGVASVLGLVVGVVAGVAVDAPALGLAAGLVLGLVIGLTSGMGAGAVKVLIDSFEGAGLLRQSTPSSSLKADRTLNIVRFVVAWLMVWLAGGLAIGIVVGVSEGVARGLITGITAGAVLGVVAGATMGLWGGRHHAWLAYVIATWRLSRRRLLPRRLMPFLEDVHRLGLLRAVGPVYQFRHAEFQDFLAAKYQESF